MTIVNSGRTRMAVLSSSTWAFFGIGTSSTAPSTGQTALVSTITPLQVINNAVIINNDCTLVGFLNATQNNSASSVVEIAFFDATTAGNMLFRSVASTATWTSFIKDATKSMLITLDLTLSS